MKLTIKQIYRDQVQGQKGPFESVKIITDEYPGKKISGYGNAQNKNWKIGDVVEVESVVPKGNFLNFTMAKTKTNPANLDTVSLMHEIKVLQGQMRQLLDHASGRNRLDRTSAGTPVPNFEVDNINPEEIPF